MEELNKLIEDLESEFIETWSRDKDGNLVKVKLYWHNQAASATIEFYVVHLQVIS